MSDDTAPSRSGQVDDRLPLLDDQGAVKQADGIVDRPAGTDGANGDTVPHSPGNGLPPQTLFGVAILILVAFLGLALFMIVNADASDPVWKNRLAIFTTVQAIVYTAVGWRLFGREVNRVLARRRRRSPPTWRKPMQTERRSRPRTPRRSSGSRPRPAPWISERVRGEGARHSAGGRRPGRGDHRSSALRHRKSVRERHGPRHAPVPVRALAARLYPEMAP